MSDQRSSEKAIRLQIPVSKRTAEEIDKLARRFDRSQAWTTRLLLTSALDDRKHFVDWLSARVGRVISATARVIGGNRRPKKSSQSALIRLQVPVSESLARGVEQLAERMNNTPPQAAALLVESAVDDHDWVLKLVSTPIMEAVGDWLYGERPPEAELTDSSSEEEAT